MTAALQVEDLTVAYRRDDRDPVVVLQEAGLSLHAGSILGLAGESGCGKSTLALAAIGYSAPGSETHAGISKLDGVDLTTLSTRELRTVWGARIGYVGQSAALALNPAIPIGRQIGQVLSKHLGLRRTERRERELELLEAVGLPEPAAALRRFAHQFSGGQQQRIAIAIAIACNPAVLVLDEPTTGLDVTTQARMSCLLRRLVDESGTAALYVSHDIGLLSTVVDEMAVMYAGEIVETGPTDLVLRSPRHPYTRALLASAPSARQRRAVVGIDGRPPGGVVQDACSFAPRCRHARDQCRSGRVPMISMSAQQSLRCLFPQEGPLPVPALVSPAAREQETHNLLSVESLSCTYAKANTPAVNDVSFGVRRGETLGIVGESGSGKSTLLRAIGGLHAPSSGAILVEGEELPPTALRRSRAMRRDIQLIFQNPDSSLNPQTLIEDILRRPVRLFQTAESQTDEAAVIADLLDAVRLPTSVLRRYPAELSGGEKQRVAIARAFAPRPRLLLCDEVTSALDVSVQATIVRLIGDVASTFGTAVIFVSHDLAVVRTIAARTLVMRDGEVIETGTTDELFAAPREPYTRELLEAVPDLPVSTSTDSDPKKEQPEWQELS